MGITRGLILRNTASLFVRSGIVALIGLYASRVLLEKLGIEDFGVYHIAASVVLMFGSLQTMCTNAIQRYLNYSKGEEDVPEKLNLVFNSGVQIQMLLSIVFVILTETIGLYAFKQLNLTVEQFPDAFVVFQLTIATLVISILKVPYEALILAHEKMNVYALISIVDWSLQLVIIFLIGSGPFSKLANYALLLFLVSCMMRILTICYCRIHFAESRMTWKCNWTLMKKMISFASWNFLGYTGFNIAHQGVNYLLNLMGGVVVNAARSITYQIMSGVGTLVSNTNMAFKPQINAAAANDDRTDFYRLLGYNAKTAFVCYLLIVVPVLIYAKPIVGLWLGQVPPFVVTFLIAVSFYHLLLSLHVLVNQFFISIGEMKWYQVIEFFTILMALPFSWFLLKYGSPFWMVFIAMAIMELVNHSGAVILAVKKFGFPIKYYIREVYLPFLMVSIIAFAVVEAAYWTKVSETEGGAEIFLGVLAVECLMFATSYFLVLQKDEKKRMQEILATYLRKWRT